MAEKLLINSNTFALGNSVMQVSNISRIIIEKEKSEVPSYVYRVFAIGIVLILSKWIFADLLRNDQQNSLALLGIFLAVIAGFLLVWIKASGNMVLRISLNSGVDVNLYGDIQFLKEILDVMIECMNGNRSYTINFSDCTIIPNNKGIISNGNVKTGKNSINGGATNSPVIGDKNKGNIVISYNDWEILEKFFDELLLSNQLYEGEEDIINEAKKYAAVKDQEGLKRLFKLKERIWQGIFEGIEKIVTGIFVTKSLNIIQELTNFIFKI